MKFVRTRRTLLPQLRALFAEGGIAGGVVRATVSIAPILQGWTHLILVLHILLGTIGF
jgi:hypothetical protein